MPRSGGGVYSAPVGTEAVAGSVIESAKYNALVTDIVADLNAPRPISVGGTGAASALDARTNLGIIADNVPFTQSGTAAVPRSVGDRLRDYLAPEDFGTTGTADDGAVVLAAINEAVASGRQLIFRGGRTYTLATWAGLGVTLASLIRMRGEGAIIRGPVSGAGIFLRPNGASFIEGVTFDRWSRALVRLIADGGDLANAVLSENNFTLVDSPIDIERPCALLTVKDNRVSGGAGAAAIRIGTNDDTLEAGWNGVTVRGNRVVDRTTTGTIGNYPILLYTQHSLVEGNIVQRIRSQNAECFGIYVKQRWGAVSGNTVEDVKSTGASGAFADVVGVALKGDNRVSTTVSPGGYKNACLGNTMRNIGTGMSHGTGIRTQGHENVISGNTIEDVGGMGIDANDTWNVGSIITQNSIRGWNILGTQGIWASGISGGAIIANNQIFDFLNGVRADGGASAMFGLMINDNQIQTTRASSIGIRLASGAVRNWRASGNRISLPGTATAIFAFDSGSHIDGTISGNELGESAAVSVPLLSGTSAGLRINDNCGYRSRTADLVAIPNGAGTAVNHNLFKTPAGGTATLFNNTTDRVTITTYDATTITIAHSAATSQSVFYTAWVPEDVI